MAHVVEINRPEQLEDLRLVWNSLASQTPGLSLFHTLDWLQVYWKHFGAGQHLRVLLVVSANKPIGIVPLTVIEEKTRAGRVRVLTYPLHDHGTFYGPIGPNPAATLTLAFNYLHASPREWDLLDMRWVNRDEHDRFRTKWAMERAGYAVRESIWKHTAVIEMQAGWDQYWESRSSKMRSNLRRDEKRLRAQGHVEYIRYRPAGMAAGDDDPRWDLYQTCVEIAAASWQGASETGTTLSHERVAEYFREVHAIAVKHGMVDINILKVAGRAVAFSYNYVSNGELVGMRRGHLPEFSRWGVGNLLFLRMLKESFQRGDRNLDLGPGSRDIKRGWSTHSADSYRYTHYPLFAPRVQLLRLKHWARGERSAAHKHRSHCSHLGSTPVSSSM
ncbi:MAG: GNAT family N-acetyltransferase [Planctomycetota bacterium]